MRESDCPVRSLLLPEREEPIDQNDRDDGARECVHPGPGAVVFGEHRQGCRCPKDDGEEVRQLGNEEDERGTLGCVNQAILAKLEAAPVCVVAGESACARVQARERVGHAQSVNRARHGNAFGDEADSRKEGTARLSKVFALILEGRVQRRKPVEEQHHGNTDRLVPGFT